MKVVRSYGEGESSHIVIHPRLAERFEYEIHVRINEDGNVLEFKEKKSSANNVGWNSTNWGWICYEKPDRCI